MLSRFTNRRFGRCYNLYLAHSEHLIAKNYCFNFYLNNLSRKMKLLTSSVYTPQIMFRSVTFSHFKKYETFIPSNNSESCSLNYFICTRDYNSVSVEDLPVVSVSEIKKTLKINGITFEEGYTCLITDCLACMKPDCGKVFINKTTGYFICYKCRHAGTWDLFQKLLQHKKKKTKLTKIQIDVLKKDSEIIKEVNNLWTQVEKDTQLLSSLSEEAILNILSEFNFTNISASALELLEIRVDKERSKLYIPLQDVEGQKAGFKILSKETKKAETLPKKGCGGIMCSKIARGVKQDAAVIVPEVADALALAAHRIGYQIVCLPHGKETFALFKTAEEEGECPGKRFSVFYKLSEGLSSLPQQVLPALERYSKLVLWFGNDIVSWDIARNFAKKLGDKRCYFVRPIEKQPSPYIALLEKKDLKAIINGAQPIWHQAITTFSSLREDVLSELQNNDKVEGVKWTRFPALNRILKGHRRGEFTVLTGPTGSGKTTFISEYSLDLAMQGVNTLWGSFEIRNARLARTMLQQMAEMPLNENMDKFDILADAFERLPIYFMNFHGQQSIKLVMEAVEHATYVHDIAHLIIDNVQFMMGVSDESRHMDRFWKQDTIIANFRSFATKKNCHVTLVIHPRKENNVEDLTISSVFGGAKATQEADNILIIQDKRLTSVRGKKYLQVAKNRYSGDLGVMPLEFHKESLSYGQRKKKLPNEKTQPSADTV